MHASQLFAALAAAAALITIFATLKQTVWAPKPLHDWLVLAMGKRASGLVRYGLPPVQLACAAALVAFPLTAMSQLGIVSACLALLLGKYLARLRTTEPCPCLDASSGLHPQAAMRLTAWIALTAALGMLLPSSILLSETAYCWALTLWLAGLLVLLINRTAAVVDSDEITETGPLLREIVRGLPELSVAKAHQQTLYLFLGSTKCQACTELGQRFGHLARAKLGSALFVADLDFAPPSRLRLGGADLVNLGAAMRASLGISLRPSLIVVRGDTAERFHGPERSRQLLDLLTEALPPEQSPPVLTASPQT